MSKRKALITGITGQDGSYLAELLLEKDYEVHGLVRRIALENPSRRFTRIAHILNDLRLHAASLENYPTIFQLISRYDFDECYHFAAQSFFDECFHPAATQSFVAESFADGFATMNININGTHYLLAALRELRPECRFYFAGSSEMFGRARETPQSETTVFHPRNPYGISKIAGFDLTRNYRETYNMFCCSGLLFNHESPRRGVEFVTRKITGGAAAIKLGLANELKLGNLDARRDWGHAADYVEAIYLMMRETEADDYVIATGEAHSVREFCEIAFAAVDLDYRDFVVADGQFYRPAETTLLIGDATKAREKLGWQPRHTFREIIEEMVARDLETMSAK